MTLGSLRAQREVSIPSDTLAKYGPGSCHSPLLTTSLSLFNWSVGDVDFSLGMLPSEIDGSSIDAMRLDVSRVTGSSNPARHSSHVSAIVR